jgi:hypothetical protein
VDGKQVLFYKPTPLACADCHGTNIPKEKEKSALSPWSPSTEASITPGFHPTKFHAKMRKTQSSQTSQNIDHVSLNLMFRAPTYLRCLDPVNCRSCDSSVPERAIKMSEGAFALTAYEYLRQPGS